MDDQKQNPNAKKSLLSSHDLKGLAEYILSNGCTKIAILAGAGISVSAGIRDYRSKNGFYNTLNLDNFPTLTDLQKRKIQENPQMILSFDLFKTNPEIYMMIHRDMILNSNKYKPTLTHWFFRLLFDKKLLKRFYSTNIDGLDIKTKIPDDILINVHGKLNKIYCISCKKKYDINKFKELIKQKTYLNQAIRCNQCNGTPNLPNYVKPETVMFGESLPKIYLELEEQEDLKDVDLLIVTGTSLKVMPTAFLPDDCNKEKCVRFLCNRDLIEGVFDFTNNYSNDIFYKGNCDNGFLELSTLLGWKNDLLNLMQQNQCN